MKRIPIMAALLVGMALITGCWDAQNVEKINYISAIGLDYEKPNYVVYAQLLEFSAIAKQESPESRGGTKTWVGKGIGESLNLAMNDLYNTAQQRMVWSHVTTIFIGEKALKQWPGGYVDALTRFREIRLTPWVFATKQPITEIMNAPAFFNLSPRDTISHSPAANYMQHSWILPLQYMTFLGDYNEPARTVILPILSINPDQWEKSEKPDPKLTWDGAFIMSGKKIKGALKHEDLKGLRWVIGNTVRSPLKVQENGKLLGVVSLEDPLVHIDVKQASGRPQYHLRISLQGNVVELFGDTPEKELVAAAKKMMENEIRFTYEKGIAIHADVLQLQYALYLQHYKDWKRMSEDQLALDKNSLDGIDIQLKLLHSGMLKEKK
ncbi:Ger(x)C family spore germination protein [Paenibacillus sp. OAS669]|uniref:Ger(x)C family spore germination protein n=1 Tax=Paenibacillus sp. OAS669 TaxID=2663821 RepID=UPI00178B8679|nr:Ger(x)C family spore germination protein [Paenibacillus sp. OAS669]MBE1446231.1 Ger(x)C family germination protein [Paenibacillus sp. OAS669]